MTTVTNVDIRIKTNNETKKKIIERYRLIDKNVHVRKVACTLTDVEMSAEFIELIS